MSRTKTGSWHTCQHPDRLRYWAKWDDMGEPLDEPEPMCGWCGRRFASWAAMRRERKARKAAAA